MIESDNHRLFKTFETPDGSITFLSTSYSQINEYLTCPYKWYLKYSQGIVFDEKRVALSYGKCVHALLEEWLKSNRTLTKEQLSDIWNKLAEKEQIPWESLYEESVGTAQVIALIVRMTELYYKPESECTPFEKMLRMVQVAGVEEEIRVPVKLLNPTTIKGQTFDKVYIVGSIDFHGYIKGKHILVDHKSGNKLFPEYKLKNDLQFPIYSMHLYQKFKCLPYRCYYHFTRTGEYQIPIVDDERFKKSIQKIKETLDKMYSLKSEEEYVPHHKQNPFKLCYWCDYGKYSHNLCPYSSDYKKE